MGDLKQKRGYWNLKEEDVDRTLRRTRSGTVNGPVVRQTRGIMRFNEPFVDSHYFY